MAQYHHALRLEIEMGYCLCVCVCVYILANVGEWCKKELSHSRPYDATALCGLKSKCANPSRWNGWRNLSPLLIAVALEQAQRCLSSVRKNPDTDFH